MSETTPAPVPGAAPRPPPLVVNIQYVKDLSFEVPGAPQIYSQLRGQPQVNINLDVQARRVQELPADARAATANRGPYPGHVVWGR